ncbi:MAG: UDP-N-acetylmuramate dehydrogenase [Prevotellaceae bacterium]|nr:UDP-N-acetylmuramate dehydrogenase [Prevotellaceae bacterium]
MPAHLPLACAGRHIPNTFGLDVRAARYLEYASVDELRALLASGAVTKPFLHVGAGSNLLFLEDYPGTILHSRIGGVYVVAEDGAQVLVRVGAGVPWDDFVAFSVERQWYGAENLSGIPGETGAAAVQNIGAYGVEISSLVDAVETVDIEGNERVYQARECGYTYRGSLFKQPAMKRVFVTHVRLRLGKTPSFKLDYGAVRQELAAGYPSVTLQAVREVVLHIRGGKLPNPEELGNAGSFFMNPVVSRERYEALRRRYPDMPGYLLEDGQVKLAAGWLIEQSGWKGKALGRAAVHHKQALVLVNTGGATGADIARLSEAVRASVRQLFDIDLRPEVNFIPSPSSACL